MAGLSPAEREQILAVMKAAQEQEQEHSEAVHNVRSQALPKAGTFSKYSKQKNLGSGTVTHGASVTPFSCYNLGNMSSFETHC